MSKAQKPTKNASPKFSHLFVDYLQEKNYSPRTVKSHSYTAHKFMDWVDKQKLEIEQLNYNHITTYIKHLKKRGVSMRTVAMEINAIKLLFKALINNEIVAINPVSHINLQGVHPQTLHHILQLDELDLIYKTYPKETTTQQRNKAILGLLIYQGITVSELNKLTCEDLNLEEGEIYIREGRRSNARTLKLQAHQAIYLNTYVLTTREEILKTKDSYSEKLILNTGTSSNLKNSLVGLVNHLKKNYQEFKGLNQIRASVITAWVKQYNLRQAQYMAGHRFVSSTEKYRENDIESLEKSLEQFRPSLNLEAL